MLDRVAGRHCLVTGASCGLGKSVCIELARRGANITAIARRKAQLDEAVAHILANAGSRRAPLVVGITADCTNREEVDRAVEQSLAAHDNEPPFLVICCVGYARPMAFLDHDKDDFMDSMNANYLSAVQVVQSVLPLQLQIPCKQQGGCSLLSCKKPPASAHIVLVSSVAGLLGFGGYSSYAPAKAALKAFADVLRHELAPTRVRVHLFLPSSFASPGFAEEQKIKPELTRQVESGDPVLSSDECARQLLSGIDKGHFTITTSLTGELIRCAGLVHSPPNNFFFDFIKCILAFVVLTFWRCFTLDKLSRNYPLVPVSQALPKTQKQKQS